MSNEFHLFHPVTISFQAWSQGTLIYLWYLGRTSKIPARYKAGSYIPVLPGEFNKFPMGNSNAMINLESCLFGSQTSLPPLLLRSHRPWCAGQTDEIITTDVRSTTLEPHAPRLHILHCLHLPSPYTSINWLSVSEGEIRLAHKNVITDFQCRRHYTSTYPMKSIWLKDLRLVLHDTSTPSVTAYRKNKMLD
jgi:hypothetical protein